MEKYFDELKRVLSEVSDLKAALSVLHWDQATHMPPGGAEGRAAQISLLSKLIHEKGTQPRLGALLEKLWTWSESFGIDSYEYALTRLAQRQFQRNLCVPGELMGELSAHASKSYELWVKAKAAGNFKMVQAALEKTLDLSQSYAACFKEHNNAHDALIAEGDYGMDAATVSRIFHELREELVPLVKKATEQKTLAPLLFKTEVDEATQLAFSKKVIEQMGYSFERGRMDLTQHPFMISFGWGDTRITVRTKKEDPLDCFYSALHEAGHAMYEQGISKHYDRGPLLSGTSTGVHESQSRLWENIVGRSRAFWSHYLPLMKKYFGAACDSLELEEVYRGVNHVETSLIRVDADELTYNLHVMIRFDLEADMLSGKLKIADLPEAWRARYKSDLGLSIANDSVGCMQDVHWYAGLIGGYFQGYTLGNILSAQFFDAAKKQRPQIESDIAFGDFAPLRTWLSDNIYCHGSKYTAPELIKKVTGSDISIRPYMTYLKEKFS